MKYQPLKPILALSLSIFILSLINSCGGGNSLANLTGRELFDKGMDKYSHKKYIQAIDYLQALIYSHPGETYVDTAQYYLAMSYYGNGDFALSSVEFNRLALNYPSSDFFDDAVFMRGVSQYESTPDHYGLDQSDLQKAIDYLRDFLIDFPESEHVEDAKALLANAEYRMARKYYEAGVVYSRIGGFKAAEIYFQKVIDDYTSSEFTPMASFKSAEMKMKQRKFTEAEEAFEKFQVVFKEHELAPRARKKMSEAAFMAGEYAYKNEKYGEAKTLLEHFQSLYPESKKFDDAAQILKELPELTPDTVEVTDAGL